MDINLKDYDKVAEKYKLLQFSQPGLELGGSILRANKIQGSFGIAEIINSRNDPTLLLHAKQIISIHNEISRATIIKSNKNKKQKKAVNEEDNKNQEEEDEQQIQPPKKQESNDSLLQEDSEIEKQQQAKEKRIRKKKKVGLKKELKNKLKQLYSEQKIGEKGGQKKS